MANPCRIEGTHTSELSRPGPPHAEVFGLQYTFDPVFSRRCGGRAHPRPEGVAGIRARDEHRRARRKERRRRAIGWGGVWLSGAPGFAVPNNCQGAPTRPAGRAGMKGAGSLAPPRRRKHRTSDVGARRSAARLGGPSEPGAFEVVLFVLFGGFRGTLAVLGQYLSNGFHTSALKLAQTRRGSA